MKLLIKIDNSGKILTIIQTNDPNFENNNLGLYIDIASYSNAQYIMNNSENYKGVQDQGKWIIVSK